MHRGAAADDDQPVKRLQPLSCQRGQSQRGQALRDARAQRAEDGVRLLVNLLEHEVGVAALLRGLHVPLGGLQLFYDRRAGEIHDLDALRAENRDLARLQLVVGAGVFEQRRDVGGHVAAVLAGRDDERAVLPGGEDHAGGVPEHHAEGVGAGQLARRLGQGLEGVAGFRVMVVDQLRGDLGVGLGLELVAVARKKALPFEVVLYNAVVHQVQPLGAVGVGVDVRGLAVGGPAGVADAAMGGNGVLTQDFFDVRKPSLGLDDFERAVLKCRDAGGIVPPVFQRREPRHKPGDRVLAAGISDNPAHTNCSFNARRTKKADPACPAALKKTQTELRRHCSRRSGHLFYE